MQILISDANIFIDLEEAGLLNLLFKLPFTFKTPDILYVEELEDQHAYLLSMGLELSELSPETLLYAMQLVEKVKGPSTNDCFALASARQEGSPLLTGDNDLRRLAKEEAIVVMGTIWVVEQMVINGLISTEVAYDSYDKMKSAGRRLPWDLALSRLKHI